MKLTKFVEQLQKLIDEGHGDLHVLYRHGSSGDCGELSYPSVTDDTNDCGPFLSDMGLGEDGDSYISIYAGH